MAGSYIGQKGTRAATIALVAISALTCGCVRRTVSAIFPRSRPVSRAKIQRTLTPDESLRHTFEQQTHEAFNPLTDDRTIQMLRTRLRINPADPAARVQLAAIYE